MEESCALGQRERRTSNFQRRTSNVEPKKIKERKKTPSVCSFRLFCSTFGVRCSMFDVRILQSSVFSSSVFFTRQKTASLQDTRRKTREPSASLGKREHRTSNAEHPTSNRREKDNAFCLFLSPLLFDVRRSAFDVRRSMFNVRLFQSSVFRLQVLRLRMASSRRGLSSCLSCRQGHPSGASCLSFYRGISSFCAFH